MNVTDNFSRVTPEMRQVRRQAFQRSEHQTPAVEPSEPFLVSAMSTVQRRELHCILGAWVVVGVLFWAWWFEPRHIVDPWRFGFNSAVLACAMMLPAYYFIFFARIRKPNPRLRFPIGHRVAMVVTKAPAEPWALVRGTLEGMLAQNYPHDTWLADEDPSAETLDWCRRNGVRVSSRKNVAEYHRPTWPRRTKCKEGNLAYFYDNYGYDRYDFVVQMDADHRPARGYLEAMLRPFLDSDVGYVSAPSICSANASESWTARGRLTVEAPLHGALQAGYNGGFAPLCIGSHYAVRTFALRDIGGLGPELAEDHSTTFLFNVAGWKGIHSLDAEAIGEGPSSFADFATQEFQWARSLIRILLTLTPRHIHKLPFKLKFQFLFSQSWYLLLSFTMLMSVLIPIIAICTDQPFVSISYVGFACYSSALSAVLIPALLWMRRNGWCRPKEIKLMTWEAVLLQFARWPWVMLGIIAACRDALLKENRGFRVTRKGGQVAEKFPIVLLVPYALLTVLSGLPVILIPDANYATGYYFASSVNSLIYSLTALAIVFLR
jgi:cellulose synthase/poly-beta-1,6-N-acetylglucosamine synthase-like glycosyltransferase